MDEGPTMAPYQTKPLNAETWPDFARLVEANNGVWGGCWCMWYHAKTQGAEDTPEAKRKAKECLVHEGRAHAALVYNGPDCIGWCQFGSPSELPRIHNQKAYGAANAPLPDWRITCFFSGKGHRGTGVAAVALKGAIEQIQALGGFDKLMETLKQRLEEQKGRHQGGNKWIGTAGTSPFGAYGYNPEGVRIGQDESRHRRAVKVWDKREFKDLDGSVDLGTRNIKVALKRLRRFARTGAHDELDLDGTIKSTAERGYLDVQMRPEDRKSTRLNSITL